MIVIFIGIGLLTGILMGIVGIGSGLLLLQFLMWAGMSFKESVAVSLVMQIVPQTLPAALMYHKQGHVKLKETAYVVLGSLVGVTIGAYFATRYNMNLKILYTMTGLLLVMGAFYFFYKVWKN